MTNSFQNVRPLRYWIQMVLPLVYDDSLSYMELLGKVTNTLNQLVENNNKLPDYIMNLIKEYINSGEIKEVLQEVLASFILNVKFPPAGITPAKGDGTVDDSASIQGCIDYAATTGGVVYFPYGVYMCKDIELKDNVSLKGFDRYTTRLVGFGGAQTAIIKGTASNLTIADLSISANAGAQANQVDCINLQGSNYLFSNLFLVNAYRHLVLNTTAGHVQMDNIITNSAIDCSMNIDGSANIQASQIELGAIANTGTCSITINTSDGIWDIHAQSPLEPAVIIGGTGNDIILSTSSLEPIVPETSQNNVVIRGTSAHITLNDDVNFSANNAAVNTLQSLYINSVNMDITSDKKTENIKVDDTIVTTKKTLTTPLYNQNIGALAMTGNSSKQSWNTFKVSADTKFEGPDFDMSPNNPMGYKLPQKLNNIFNYVEFKNNNIPYKVLVEGEDLNNYFSQEPVNVLTLGFDNTGQTDISTLFNQYSPLYNLYFPNGTYKVSSPLIVVNSVFGGGNNFEINTGKDRGTFFISDMEDGDIFSLQETVNISLSHFNIVCNNNEIAIHNKNTLFRIINIENITIYGIQNIGIFCDTNSDPATRLMQINNCALYGKGLNNHLGIKINSNGNDCLISNTKIMCCQIGIEVAAYLLNINNVHIYCGPLAVTPTEQYAKFTKCMDIRGGHVIANQLYLDSAYVDVQLLGGLLTASNVIIWDGGIFSLTDGTAFYGTGPVKINGLTISSNLNYYIYTYPYLTANNVTVFNKNQQYNKFNFPYYPVVQNNTYTFTTKTTGLNITEFAWVDLSYGSFQFTVGDSANLALISYNGQFSNKVIQGNVNIYYKTEGSFTKLFFENSEPRNLTVTIQYARCFGRPTDLINFTPQVVTNYSDYSKIPQEVNS